MADGTNGNAQPIRGGGVSGMRTSDRGRRSMPAGRSAGAGFGVESAASVRIARKPATGAAWAPVSRWQPLKQGSVVVEIRCIGHDRSFLQHDARADDFLPWHPAIDGTV